MIEDDRGPAVAELQTIYTVKRTPLRDGRSFSTLGYAPVDFEVVATDEADALRQARGICAYDVSAFAWQVTGARIVVVAATDDAGRKDADRAFWESVSESDDPGREEETALVREPDCVAAWPGCVNGEHNPACCRWPKSCSVRMVPAADDAGHEQAESHWAVIRGGGIVIAQGSCHCTDGYHRIIRRGSKETHRG